MNLCRIGSFYTEIAGSGAQAMLHSHALRLRFCNPLRNLLRPPLISSKIQTEEETHEGMVRARNYLRGFAGGARLDERPVLDATRESTDFCSQHRSPASGRQDYG